MIKVICDNTGCLNNREEKCEVVKLTGKALVIGRLHLDVFCESVNYGDEDDCNRPDED